MRDVRSRLAAAREHPRRITSTSAPCLENAQGLRRQRHTMRQLVLAALGGNRPPPRREVELCPSRAVDFPATLCSEQANAEERGDEGTLVVKRLPDAPDLILAQD